MISLATTSRTILTKNNGSSSPNESIPNWNLQTRKQSIILSQNLTFLVNA